MATSQHMNKSDKVLGTDVQKHLISLGIETPMIASSLTEDEKLERLMSNYAEIHETLGLDLEDDSLMETPKRIAKLQLFESFKGLDYNNFPKMTVVDNKFYTGMVSVNDIQLISMCEHHWERVLGNVNISYIPTDKVVGLSKLSRLVDFFASRPIVQERFTSQVFETLKYIMDTEDIAVNVKSTHLCMFARGVKEPCSNTFTTLLGGRFLTEDALRNEFMSQINYQKSVMPQ